MPKETNELWSLLEAKKPDNDDIMTCINDHPSYCSLAVHLRKSSSGYDELPIHRAIKNRLTMDVIRKMISCYPECCMKKYKGNLLLHHILRIMGDDESDDDEYNDHYNTVHDEYVILDDIIMNVIDIYPDAVRVKNEYDHQLPLLIECEHHCRYNVIIKLVNIYPDAITTACRNNYLPLHSALSNDRSTSEVILYIIEQHQDAVCALYDGSLPIHMECETLCRYDVVMKLLDINPEAIDSVDKNGDYPLHLACMSYHSTLAATMYLINSYEHAASMKDSHNLYPLHLECRKHCRYEVVMRLLDIFPDAVSIPDDHGEHPLHLMILSDTDESLRTIPILLKMYPAAVEVKTQFCGYPFTMMFRFYYFSYEAHEEKDDIDIHDDVYIAKSSNCMMAKAIAINMLNLYPRALYISNSDLQDDIDFSITNDPRRYRLLLNLALHHLLSPQHIHDYRDMNYHARSSFLHLLHRLSSSHTIYHADDDINHYLHVDKMKHIWLWHMMILSGFEVDNQDSHRILVSYGWLKGDDLGQHLLRYVIGYL